MMRSEWNAERAMKWRPRGWHEGGRRKVDNGQCRMGVECRAWECAGGCGDEMELWGAMTGPSPESSSKWARRPGPTRTDQDRRRVLIQTLASRAGPGGLARIHEACSAVEQASG